MADSEVVRLPTRNLGGLPPAAVRRQMGSTVYEWMGTIQFVSVVPPLPPFFFPSFLPSTLFCLPSSLPIFLLPLNPRPSLFPPSTPSRPSLVLSVRPSFHLFLPSALPSCFPHFSLSPPPMLYQHPANAIFFDPPFSFVLFTRERDHGVRDGDRCVGPSFSPPLFPFSLPSMVHQLPANKIL